jgi:hypothetical protein
MAARRRMVSGLAPRTCSSPCQPGWNASCCSYVYPRSAMPRKWSASHRSPGAVLLRTWELSNGSTTRPSTSSTA